MGLLTAPGYATLEQWRRGRAAAQTDLLPGDSCGG